MTSADPVADAVIQAAADGPLVRRHAEVMPTLEELPSWVDVEDSDEMDGFDTVVWFDDEINCYCDPGDGLDQALADQPGVEVRADAMSRRCETYTSITWPCWSTAR